MSNKRYRIPAGWNDRQRAQPEPEASINQRCLEKVKTFLQTVLDKVMTALQEPPPPQEEPTERGKALGSLARLGISACRTLLQALRVEGTDTRDVRAAMDQAVASIRENIQAPVATG